MASNHGRWVAGGWLRGGSRTSSAAACLIATTKIQRDAILRILFYLFHLHPPHISMQVMARAEHTVFIGVEVKVTNLEIFCVKALRRKISGF